MKNEFLPPLAFRSLPCRAGVRATGPMPATATQFSAGRPGDPKKPARVIEVVMKEGDGKWCICPTVSR